MQIESLLFSAISSPFGVEVITSDPDMLRQKIYAVRRKNPGDFNIACVIPPSASQNILWIVRKPDGPPQAL